MTKVCLVGTAVQDLIFYVDSIPRSAEKYRSESLQVVGGVLAANAAVAVVKLGGEAVLVARVGDDAVGETIVSELEGSGVDCALVRRFLDCKSPLSAVFVEPGGERMIVTYNDPKISQAIDWLPAELPQGTQAVLGDIRWEDAALHLFALAERQGIPAVLDADRIPLDPSILRRASHVAYSHQAAREITGRNDPSEALRELSARGGNWQAVTDGARGTWFTAGEDISHFPAFQVDAVDTVAAGDTFHGALALALGERMSTIEALRFASAAAAVKCTRVGGRLGIPDRISVEQFLSLSA
jgi:sulfofructose kinase